MGNCRDCRFWGAWMTTSARGQEVGHCEYMELSQMAPFRIVRASDVTSDAPMDVRVLTIATFGCTQFDPKG
jgi:hypothetical protein